MIVDQKDVYNHFYCSWELVVITVDRSFLRQLHLEKEVLSVNVCGL